MHITVLLNIVALSLDSYPLNLGLTLMILEYINVGFAGLYIAEFLIRLLGLGFKNYIKIKFNVLDAVFAGLCVFDVILASQFLWDDEEKLFKGTFITILKLTRIMRVFKLQRFWMRFQIILETLSQTIIDVRWFSILIAIFIYMYTILGMDFFSHRAKFNSSNQVDLQNGSSPMIHFDDLLNSFFTVFVIMTNDGQFVIFQNFYRAANSSYAIAFWLTLIVLGQKILVNLFLAFLLQNFKEDTMKERTTKIEEDERQIGRMDSKISLWDQSLACFKTRIDIIIVRIMSYDTYQKHINSVSQEKKFCKEKVLHSFKTEMLRATQSMFRPVATMNQSEAT